MFKTRYSTRGYSGFLEFVCDPDTIKNLEGPLTATVMVDDEFLGSVSIQREDLPEEPSLIVDTYALSDGEHQIAIITRRGAIQVVVQIVNGDSPRANSLRIKHKSLALPSVFFGPIHSKHFGGMQKIIEISAEVNSKTESTSTNFRRFSEDGYLIQSGMIDVDDLERARADCALIEKHQGYGWTVGSSERIVSAHRELQGLRGIYSNQNVRSMVNELLGESAFPAQSLLFINGSQQDFHSDWIHLSCYPLNSMVGVWIALEDVRVGSGELAYIPRSHRHRYIDLDELGVKRVIPGPNADWRDFGSKLNEAVQKRTKLQQEPSKSFLAKAGDVIFWHENLIHGGLQRLDSELTRCSLVIHWYSQSCYAWYDSTGNVANKDIDTSL